MYKKLITTTAMAAASPPMTRIVMRSARSGSVSTVLSIMFDSSLHIDKRCYRKTINPMDAAPQGIRVRSRPALARYAHGEHGRALPTRWLPSM